MRKNDDAFARRARKEGYFARSVYKLQAIDRKFRLLRKGMRVLDLGSAPGSWIQYTRQVLGERGVVVGVDLQPVKPSVTKLATFVHQDLEAVDATALMPGGEPFDVVLSDMAPKTTGVKITDQARSLELCELALSVAERTLAPDGAFVCKIFEGPKTGSLLKQTIRPRFRDARFFKPPASRNESFETFLVAKDFAGSVTGRAP
jgi:23S rRNA (uridine2552-2'-O)-methyltransferase